MSSVVTAPEGTPQRLNRATPLPRLVRGRRSGDFLFGLVGAVVLLVVDFVAGGGNIVSPNTWIQGGLVLLAAATGIAAVLVGGRGRAWGAGTLACFSALAALTYASIAWSVQPATSWLEANRTLSYLAAFATALLLARIFPGRWRALLGALATAATLACAWSLLVKVFPGTLDPNEPLGRLQAPFAYWNAVGLMAAIGLPACLWAGARREQAPVLRALAVPAVAILIAALVLSFSRGALLVAVIGVCVWFALAPLRLRSIVVLAVGGAGAAAIAVWGAGKPGISSDNVAEATRVSAGHTFGVVILVALVLTTLAGFVVASALDRVTVPDSIRRRIGYVLIGLVALIPLGGVVALAESSRGFTGEVSHLWSRLTSTNGGVGNQPGRIVTLSNSRPHYWSLALKVGEHHPIAGVGALGFATAQVRYASTSAADWQVTHAHGYGFETFADFGAIGLAISLALLVAWLVATARTFEWSGFRRAPSALRGPPASASSDLSAERTGLIALLAIVVTFGVHSLIDWTWFIPGCAIAALACAGWLVGRGPLSDPIGKLPRRRTLSRSPGAIGAIAAIAVITLIALFVIAQPLRSSDAYSSAIDAALRGNTAVALTDARSAASDDPVSIDPLFLLATLYGDFGDHAAARHQLAEAVSRQPSNPQTWVQLGCYDLAQHSSGPATYEFHRAQILEPTQTGLQGPSQGAYCASLNG